MPNALAAVISLSAARSYLFPKQVQFQEVRVSDLAILGDSLVATKGLGGYSNDDLVAAGPETALLCRAELDTMHRSQLWLRGLPQAWVVWSETFDQQVWTEDLGKWCDAYFARLMGTVRFGAIVKRKIGETKTGGGTVQGEPVTALAPFPGTNPSSSTTFVSSALSVTGMKQGDRIVITGCRGAAKAANGTWPLVTDPDANGITIPVAYPSLNGWSAPDLAKAKVYPAVYEFQAYTNLIRRFVRGKKYGVDHALPRGRARTR